MHNIFLDKMYVISSMCHIDDSLTMRTNNNGIFNTSLLDGKYRRLASPNRTEHTLFGRGRTTKSLFSTNKSIAIVISWTMHTIQSTNRPPRFDFSCDIL